MINYQLWITCKKCKFNKVIECDSYTTPFTCPNCGSTKIAFSGSEMTDGVPTGNINKDGSIISIEEYQQQFKIKEQQSKNSFVNKYCPPKPTIKCPYCQSTNCKKIGVVSRGVSFGLFGMGSGKIGKQWHCNNCSSDF